MSNCWAIAIGINQYQFFQPLHYAQRDAQALRDFLVEEAQVPASQCVTLTDSADAVLSGAPVPNREAILEQVNTVSQKLRPDDMLWFFFSGYGVRMQGRDYLVPIDGHPEKLAMTAIALDEIFKAFERVPKSHVVIALDINRSQGALQGQGVGDQAILLAERQNRVLFLSCQPDQFSQETLALRHGFFTAALLEGLRYENCLTPESLAIYLRDRLPELAEHHWRPVQDPVTILPAEEKYVLLLPQAVALSVDAPVPVGVAAGGSGTTVGPQLPPLERIKKGEMGPVSTAGTPFPPVPTPAPIPEDTRSPQKPSLRSMLSDAWADPFWRSLITWGSAIAVALIVGVVVRNREVFTMPAVSSQPVPGVTVPPNDDTNATTEPQLQQAIAAIGQPTDSSLAGQTAAFAKAIAIAQAIPRSDPTYADAQASIERWQMTTLDLAKAQAAQQDYRGAIASARALLPTDNPELETDAQALIVTWETTAQNQSVLAKAQAMARPDQASALNEAIGTALTISSGQPFYTEAQRSIAEWSQTILQLATARADTTNYELAIQTAQLVPPGTLAYEDAQAAIAQWQEQEIQQRTSELSESPTSSEGASE